MLRMFQFGGSSSLTRPHRDRGELPNIIRALARLVICPLQHMVSFGIPSEEALEAIAACAPLVEVGAGTGYWSAVLQQRGVDIVAFDSAPPTTGFNNAFFRATFTTVHEGDSESIFGPREGELVRESTDGGRTGGSSMGGRAMLIAWPNNPDAVDNPHLLTARDHASGGGPVQPVWDAACLERFMEAGGVTVCYVGERESSVRLRAGARTESGASSTRHFQSLLTQHFVMRERHALPSWPYNVDDLTIWARRECTTAS